MRCSMGLRQHGGEHIDMGVPSRADVEQHLAFSHAFVHDGQQYLVTTLVKLERDLGAGAPGEHEARLRRAFDHAALHTVLGAKAIGPLARRRGQLVVAPDQLKGSACLLLHPGLRQAACGAARHQSGRDHALERAGQQTLDLERGRFGQHAVGVGSAGLRQCRFLPFGFVALVALVTWDGDVGGSARSFARTSRLDVQNCS